MIIYFGIGIIYALVNGLIRKIDTDGDWMIAVVWILLWPIGIASFIGAKISDWYRKKKKNGL